MGGIGENIKRIRTKLGITQEQLGERIGVTTQAVSRWERGGTPDAEILPLISDVLGVSIDVLFGREKQSLAVAVARHMSRMNEDEAYQFACGICWAIENGLLKDDSAIEDFMAQVIDQSLMDKKKDYFARIIDNNGMAFMRMSPDFCHFFLMSEPKNGSIMNKLMEPEKLRRIFSLFADEKMLKMILYIYSLPPVRATVSLISKKTGISPDEVDRRMEKLCSNNLADRCVVATENGNINAYSFRKECFVVPMLCFADEIARTDFRPFFGKFDRGRPVL